jgi:hypothetical protein
MMLTRFAMCAWTRHAFLVSFTHSPALRHLESSLPRRHRIEHVGVWARRPLCLCDRVVFLRYGTVVMTLVFAMARKGMCGVVSPAATLQDTARKMTGPIIIIISKVQLQLVLESATSSAWKQLGRRPVTTQGLLVHYSLNWFFLLWTETSVLPLIHSFIWVLKEATTFAEGV